VTKIHFADVASIKDRIYHSTAVAHITIKYNLAADMARDEEINLSYVPTAEMLANYFIKPLPKPAFLNQFAAMGIMAIRLGMGLGNDFRNSLVIGICDGFGNVIGTLRNGCRTGIRTSYGFGYAGGMAIGLTRLFRRDPCCLFESTSILLTVLIETDMIASWGSVELMGITYITMQRTMIFLASFVVYAIIWRTILCWCDMSRHTIQQKQLRIHPHTLDCLSTHHPTTQHVFVHTGGRYYDCRLMWLCCQLIH
jgi:hypothetical protein